jgi:hypothetical protein
MSGALERAAAFFLAPAAASPGGTVALPPAVRAVVLGSAADAVPLAAALALSFRARERAPAAAVSSWGHDAPRPSAASRAAAQLARRLTAHELRAVARGRLAWLALPEEPAAAAAGVRRASALVDGPLVTALGGRRPAELESLVAEHDLAIVAAGAETALARAALARLTERGIAAAACPPIRHGVSRALALAGLAAPRLAVGVSPAPRDARSRGMRSRRV